MLENQRQLPNLTAEYCSILKSQHLQFTQSSASRYLILRFFSLPQLVWFVGRNERNYATAFRKPRTICILLKSMLNYWDKYVIENNVKAICKKTRRYPLSLPSCTNSKTNLVARFFSYTHVHFTSSTPHFLIPIWGTWNPSGNFSSKNHDRTFETVQNAETGPLNAIL